MVRDLAVSEHPFDITEKYHSETSTTRVLDNRSINHITQKYSNDE